MFSTSATDAAMTESPLRQRAWTIQNDFLKTARTEPDAAHSRSITSADTAATEPELADMCPTNYITYMTVNCA